MAEKHLCNMEWYKQTHTHDHCKKNRGGKKLCVFFPYKV